MSIDVTRLNANTRAWLHGRDPSAPDGDPGLFRSGRPNAFDNGVSRVVDAEVDAVLAEARDHFQGLSWAWWCGADSRPGIAAELSARGASLAVELPVMAMRFAGAPAAVDAGELEIEEVSTGEALAEWTRVYLGAMAPGPEDFGTALESERRRSDPPGAYRRLLGRVGGRAVATSAVLLTGEVAGLYVVGVDPVARDRGHGTVMSVAALATARAAGATVATLQARSLAQPIYERLGFRTVSRYHLFTL